MKHRHLDHEAFTLAAIDDILERGDLVDWLPLLREVAADPFGPASERVLRVVSHHPMYGTTEVWRSFIERRRGRTRVSRPAAGPLHPIESPP